MQQDKRSYCSAQQSDYEQRPKAVEMLQQHNASILRAVGRMEKALAEIAKTKIVLYFRRDWKRLFCTP